MASFLRRPSNNGAANAKKNIVRFGSSEPPPGTQPQKPTKKGSFVSLLVGNSSSSNNLYFDNGVDPLGRLSVDSAPPPPPSPLNTTKKPQLDGPAHWTEELFPLTRLPESSPSPSTELVARVRYFLSQNDPTSVERSLHLALYAQQEGESALNAKLFHRFGDGLPLRAPGQKIGRKEDTPVPKTLRELLRAFLGEHDPGYLAIEGESGLDEMMAQAAEYGIDSLEAELMRKYGYGLAGKKTSGRILINPSTPPSPEAYRIRDNSSFDQMAKAAAPIESSSPSPLSPVMSAAKLPPPFEPKVTSLQPTAKARLDKAKSEKPQTFVELGLDEDDEFRGSVVRPVVSPLNGGMKSRRHDFFDDKSLRADLKAFYLKHDQKKLDPQKFEPIVQWAYKIGPSELNRRFEEKYGESLNTFIDNVQAGREGVAPGAKNVATKQADVETEILAACKSYREANPGKGFGVCGCGFSRVDHRHISSLLVSGTEGAHFNKAKPKIVLSKNIVTPPGPSKTAAPSTSNTKAVPTASNAKAAPTASNAKAVPSTSNAKFVPSTSNAKAVLPTSSAKAPGPSGSNPPAWKPAATPMPKFEVKAEGRDGPCGEYRLDLEGRSFGVCKCGWSRPEHNKAKQQVAWAQVSN